ncbi:glycopeptide [Schizopora paradoxa]|uniref:Glycopeptide n=1 Tax=Schizopora paradoxa TaxID=27342 RepID=A0A0H2RIH7_9AGAM|nr:glycopeptide [Schizopora paradoxa]
MLSIALVAVIVAAVIAIAEAESHTVTFTNNCGFGTPTLIQSENILSTGDDFTSNGPLIGASAFLQTGVCGSSGENCTLVETTLANPTSPGLGSGTDISLIPPHAFSVASGFEYFDGCDGVGKDCADPDCEAAFHNPGDPSLVTICEADNVGLNITFCD